MIHESDDSLGLANRILARMTAHVCLSEPAAHETPGRLARKTVVTGLPLRHDLAHGNPDRMRSGLGITTAYARRQEVRCHLVHDDEAPTGGAVLAAACFHLADTPVEFGRPDPTVIHRAADRIAHGSLAAAGPRVRHRAR